MGAEGAAEPARAEKEQAAGRRSRAPDHMKEGAPRAGPGRFLCSLRPSQELPGVHTGLTVPPREPHDVGGCSTPGEKGSLNILSSLNRRLQACPGSRKWPGQPCQEPQEAGGAGLEFQPQVGGEGPGRLQDDPQHGQYVPLLPLVPKELPVLGVSGNRTVAADVPDCQGGTHPGRGHSGQQ